MNIDFGKGLFDLDGKAINDKDGNPANLKGVVIESLLATFKDEQGLAGIEKLKRWELAIKIKNEPGVCDITVEEAALIKGLIGKAYGTLVVGQTWKMLEGKE